MSPFFNLSNFECFVAPIYYGNETLYYLWLDSESGSQCLSDCDKRILLFRRPELAEEFCRGIKLTLLGEEHSELLNIDNAFEEIERIKSQNYSTKDLGLETARALLFLWNFLDDVAKGIGSKHIFKGNSRAYNGLYDQLFRATKMLPDCSVRGPSFSQKELRDICSILTSGMVLFERHSKRI